MALVESFSGVRGIYGKDLTESTAVNYAHSYCSFLRKKLKKESVAVVIGRDARLSGLSLSKAIIATLDCNFIDVGIAPTPAVEFAVRHFEADGGIIITASHNEPYWNGFKFLSQDGSVLSGKEMGIVISSSRFLKNFHKIRERRVAEKNSEAIKKYSDFIFRIIGRENIEKIKSSAQKVVIDPNGGAGIIAKEIVEQAGVNVTGVNMSYGEFNRTIEPTEDSLIYLKGIIEENNADFAAAFDCDADRLEILMGDGRLLSGNYILALAVEDALSSISSPKGKAVVINNATSGIIKEIAKRFEAKVIDVEVGETNVVQEMKKQKAIIGGEGSSGGVIIPPSKCRDGILTLLSVLSIIAKSGKSLNELIKELPKYYTIKQKAEFKEPMHNKIKGCLKEHYSKKGFKMNESQEPKGSLKIITSDNSFVWFRASKTESNVFRLIADSNNKEESQKLMEEAVNVFSKASQF